MQKNAAITVCIESIDLEKKTLIKEFNFDLCQGEITLLKSPNGSGKSVLLSILAGWDNDIVGLKINGEIRINKIQGFILHENIKEYRIYARKKVGYISHKLYEESLGVTFGEEIDFIVEKYKNNIPEIIKKPIEYLKDNHERQLLVENMSKGHIQLMALLDVISEFKSYDLLLMDEPSSYLSNFHLELFIELLNFIKFSNKDCSILIATNDLRLLCQDYNCISFKNSNIISSNIFLNNITLPNCFSYNKTSIKVCGKPNVDGKHLPFSFDEDIGENESVLIIGPNGSGKSTFLNICAKLIKIKGKIIHLSNNKKINRNKLFPDFFSVLFQIPHIYEFRNQIDKILTIQKFKGESALKFSKMYFNLLKYFVIDIEQQPKTLSSGQLKMLWLVSMYGWSGRWLLDEPDAVLDAESLSFFFKMLDLHLLKGGTVLIATHSKELYKKYNFRIIDLS
jgi:ABC-type multidrug transport system ATPase subunit